jgi:polysaccharide pyruvyl transferase WcaK-like protein
MQCIHSSQYARIAIWGHSRDNRPGDDIVVSALIREVTARQRQAEIVLLSRRPGDARRRHGLTSWSSEITPSRGLWRAYKQLETCDLLIVAGSGPFAGTLPDLCRWTALARLARTPVHMLSVGAGALSPGLSRFLVKRALDAATYVSFRDPESEAIARELGVRRSCPVVPDLAFSLERDPVRRAPDGPVVVGVNPDGSLTKERGFDACVEKHVGFLSWLLAERYEVRLFHSTAAELRICERLQERLKEEGLLRGGRTLLHPEALRPDRMLDAMAGCDFVVAGGFHCILIPALSGTPVVGLAHSNQARDLLESLGQGRYAANIDRFGTPQLVDSFCSLRANAESARDLLKLRIPKCREAVRLQYDDLYGPVVEA